MGVSKKLIELSGRLSRIRNSIKTEEATKTSIVMPFLSALGYDVFDPDVVVPEFIADVGTKKGEKIDYAIMKDGVPVVLIEVKKIGEPLDNHNNQINRYFTVSDARFSILTNGVEYRFYSDLDRENKMDTVPFLILDLDNLKDRVVKELEKFTVENLDIDKILAAASRQKNINIIRKVFKEEVENPSDDFVKFFARHATSKKLTSNLVEEFRGCVKESLKNMITDMVKDELDRALNKYSEADDNHLKDGEEVDDSGIITTEEEIEVLHIVKSILSEITHPSNISGKDTKTYYGVIYGDKVTKWILRFTTGQSVKFILLPTGDKGSIRYDIESVEDIYLYKKEIQEVCQMFLTSD